MNINFILWVIIQYFIYLFMYLFMAQIILALTTGHSFSRLCAPSKYAIRVCVCVCVCVCVSMSTFLPSDPTRCSRLVLFISHPSPRISHRCKKPRVLLLEDGIRSQDLNMGCMCNYGDVIASEPFRLMEQSNLRVCPGQCADTFL